MSEPADAAPRVFVPSGRSTRILCVCEGGNVRSVGLAYLLKNGCGVDAVAIGWRFASPHTLRLLSLWADYIIVMQEVFKDKIDTSFKHKLRVVDVGPDRWGNPFADELQSFLAAVVKSWQEREFKI